MWLDGRSSVLAQQSTTTETKSLRSLAVDGNQLIVRLPEGTRELTVPDDFRFHRSTDSRCPCSELKLGMKGTATITTRTTVTPVTVTEVKNGTVVRAVRLEHHRANQTRESRCSRKGTWTSAA